MLTFKSRAGDVRIEQHKECIFLRCCCHKATESSGFVSRNTVQSSFCVYFLEQPELGKEKAQKPPPASRCVWLY